MSIQLGDIVVIEPEKKRHIPNRYQMYVYYRITSLGPFGVFLTPAHFDDNTERFVVSSDWITVRRGTQWDLKKDEPINYITLEE